MTILYLVVPCYNEQEVLQDTNKKLINKMNQLINKEIIDKNSKILYVDDGSKDKTWSIIEQLHSENNLVSGLKLSCNKGHQNALIAGLMTAKEHCDVTISIDADLQDDIDAFDGFLEKHQKENCDIVYGVRSKRDKDTFFKRTTAQGFYKFMNALGVKVVYNHADYRLMSRRAIEALSEFDEVNLFLRGIVPLIGYKSDVVCYERGERMAGESKYPLKKMLSFALQGVTSFSIKPIRFVTWLGILIFIISLFILIYTICVKIFGYTVEGWTFTVASIWMIGGVQLLCLGIVGEYIGKIYSEVKKRPKYIVETFLND